MLFLVHEKIKVGQLSPIFFMFCLVDEEIANARKKLKIREIE